MRPVRPVVVIGNGWAALASVSLLIAAGIQVRWILGSGARLFMPLASLEDGPGVQVLESLARQFNVECGELQQGVWLREFRNKSYVEPSWMKASSREERQEMQHASLWGPEQKIAGMSLARFEYQTPADVEEEIRKKLMQISEPQLIRFEGAPVVAVEQLEGVDHYQVKLGSGDEIECSQVIYADQWMLVPEIAGLAKKIHLMKKRESAGLLQVLFTHELKNISEILPSFYSLLFRAEKNENERHLWGHFSADGKKSIWSLPLSETEMADNHEITKKLRRMKTTLDRMFQGSDFIPAGKSHFSETLSDEQVRFEEEGFFIDHEEVATPIQYPQVPGLFFLTDGYGPALAFQQASDVANQVASKVAKAGVKEAV